MQGMRNPNPMWLYALAGAGLIGIGYAVGAGGAAVNSRAVAQERTPAAVEPEIIATPFDGSSAILFTVKRGAEFRSYIVNTGGGVIETPIE